MRKPRSAAILAAALATALALAAVATGTPEVVRVGNLVLTDDGGISPQQLPKHGSAPITAHIEGAISTVDGGHPPAVQTIDAEIDRTIKLDAVGIPVCHLGQITATSSAAAKQACPDAIVGSGSAEVEVGFPEQAPFRSTGPIVLFNAGVQGKTTKVLLHAYVDVPAPTAVIVPAEVTRINDGRFGLELKAKVPRIAGGAGSATKFRINIGRRFTYKGQRRSFLEAGCPADSWQTKGLVSFADGSELAVHHVFRCTGTS
jgi:hypothetical protein